jgi:hypothetical protein
MSGDHNMNQQDQIDFEDLKEYVLVHSNQNIETNESKSIVLNREQIEKLYEIVSHFKEINKFTVETDHSSGIGVGVVVKFDLFQKNDTQIDITDVKEW